MSKELAGKRSGEGSALRREGPTATGQPAVPKERAPGKSSSTIPAGRELAAQAKEEKTHGEAAAHSSREHAAAGSSGSTPRDGTSLGPTNHAGMESRQRGDKSVSSSTTSTRRHKHKEEKGKKQSRRSSSGRLPHDHDHLQDARCRPHSHYDYGDDDDEYQNDAGAPGYYDNGDDNEDEGMAAITALLRAASASQTSTCQRPHVDTGDCDTLYLLSLRDCFKRLSASQKSTAMIRIQTVLHEIEFGKLEL